MALFRAEDELDRLYAVLARYGGIDEFGEKVRVLRAEVRAMRDTVLLQSGEDE